MTIGEMIQHVGSQPIDLVRVSVLEEAARRLDLDIWCEPQVILSHRQVRTLCAACQVELPEGVEP